MYRVIARFMDLQDANHIYELGDTFPRTGSKAGKARIDELMSDRNRIGFPLIEYVPDPEPEKAPEKKTTRRKVAKDA